MSSGWAEKAREVEQRLCLWGKLVAVKFFRIPPFGAQADPTPGWPPTYRKLMEEGEPRRSPLPPGQVPQGKAQPFLYGKGGVQG